LSISQTLVQAMGGQLLLLSKTPAGEWATNVPLQPAPPFPEQAHGTVARFTLNLPLADVSFSPEPAQPPVRVIGVKGTPPAVLVIDDNADNRAVLVGMLAPLGFRVLEAADGETGLAQASAQRPRAAIIDLMLPGLDGFEVIHRLRADEALNRLVVIAASASVLPEERQQSLAAGADGFLPKPVQAAELYQLLGELLALEWEYETTLPSTLPIVEPIELPSSQVLDDLYQLSLVGDASILLEFVKKLRLDYPDFAGQVQQLTESLQLNELTAWLESLLVR
jgi:CheY-like chemotaxis protein